MNAVSLATKGFVSPKATISGGGGAIMKVEEEIPRPSVLVKSVKTKEPSETKEEVSIEVKNFLEQN